MRISASDIETKPELQKKKKKLKPAIFPVSMGSRVTEEEKEEEERLIERRRERRRRKRTQPKQGSDLS